MALSYNQWKNLVSILSVMNVPIGIFTGWMAALGNFWFVIGAIGLMIFDWFGSRAWLKVIENATHHPPLDTKEHRPLT